MKSHTKEADINSLKLQEKDIHPDALYIVQTLQKRGHTTFLVGGCVRDLLLGKHPKDFDIATLAQPKEVRQAIYNSFIIGKRFRLVLVKRGDIQFEVATFRREATAEDLAETNEDQPPIGDNLFGTPEEDANRRDFTINALFYDPVQHQLIDYANGLNDLKMGLVKMIGNPEVRLLEDPIRILRAIRLAHMIRFSLDSDLRRCMQKHAASLAKTHLPRRREEILKYLRLDNPALPFLTSLDLGVLDFVSPTIAEIMRDTSKSEMFLNYLFTFHDKKLEAPVELFAGLVVAYFLSSQNGVFPANLRAHDILDNPKILKLMRDELGMFKAEQALVAKAMHLMTLFTKRKEFEFKGERRRRALVMSDAFDLALKISEREHWLSAHELQFWQNEFSRLAANDVGDFAMGELSPSGGRTRGGGAGAFGGGNSTVGGAIAIAPNSSTHTRTAEKGSDRSDSSQMGSRYGDTSSAGSRYGDTSKRSRNRRRGKGRNRFNKPPGSN